MLELWIEGTVDETTQLTNSGVAAAIATNPAIMAKLTQDGQSLEEVVTAICSKTEAPLYVQLHGPDVDHYKREMEGLLNISTQIHPKLVADLGGIAAVKPLKAMGRKPLVTTVATLNQAYLAAAVEADYIAPYIGRIADAGGDTTQLLHDIRKMYDRSGALTQIAAASVRSPEQAENALRAGAHVLVMGYGVYQRLLDDDLTQAWIAGFEENWQTFSYNL